MKFEWFLYVTLCLLSLHTGGMSTATEIPTQRLQRHGSDPPPHTELVAMARYTLHNAGWASITTASALPAIEGLPFSNVKPIADGYIANSTGIPYFYMSPDLTTKGLLKDNHATVLVSSEETMFFENQLWDPEDHQSTRLMLKGMLKKVEEGTPEYTFAKGGLFERHPVMANFPADHDWVVAKLNIEQIAMVNYSGGTEYIPVKDYLAYNYTQTTATRRTKRQEGNLGSIEVSTVNSRYSQIVFDRDQLSRLLGTVQYTKLLGVTLDSALKWEKHVDVLCGKLSGACFALARRFQMRTKLHLYGASSFLATLKGISSLDKSEDPQDFVNTLYHHHHHHHHVSR